MRYVLLGTMIFLVFWQSAFAADAPTEQQIRQLLQQCQSTHRVLWGDDGVSNVKQVIAADPDIAYVYHDELQRSDQMLGEPLAPREMMGERLLATSRRVLDRTIHLGMAYRMTGDKKYAQRAVAEMLNAAGYSNWNPSHYLDVAEMTAALAIGLDWCKDTMTPDQIAIVQTAIINKGIKPSFDSPQTWVNGENNWNQVCNCGLLLGALAIGDADLDLSAKTIARAVSGLPHVMKNYDPDGAYPEGPMYWGYGTTYNAMGLAALQNALGTDFDLSNQPGFRKTGTYLQHMYGPTAKYFNYSDCRYTNDIIPVPSMFYFARLTHDDSLVYQNRQWIRSLRQSSRSMADACGNSQPDVEHFFPLILIWATAGQPQPPVARSYTGQGLTPVATHRTSWDTNATFVAIKGGSPSTSHAHMDIGSFVIDALGERWVDNLGMQEYQSLESAKVLLWDARQNGQRWQVFRIGPMSHNILTVDDQLLNVNGNARIVESDDAHTLVDLTPVYAGQLAAAQRGVWLHDDGSVLLRDEVTAGDSSPVIRFALLTRASVQIRGSEALLQLNGKKLTMSVSGLSGIHLETFSTTGRHAYDAANPGTAMLGFKVRLASHAAATWSVMFRPQTPIAR